MDRRELFLLAPAAAAALLVNEEVAKARGVPVAELHEVLDDRTVWSVDHAHEHRAAALRVVSYLMQGYRIRLDDLLFAEPFAANGGLPHVRCSSSAPYERRSG